MPYIKTSTVPLRRTETLRFERTCAVASYSVTSISTVVNKEDARRMKTEETIDKRDGPQIFNV